MFLCGPTFNLPFVQFFGLYDLILSKNYSNYQLNSFFRTLKNIFSVYTIIAYLANEATMFF